MELLDQVIVITGAASGLGRALALKVAKMGAQLALIDMDEAKLQATFDEIALPPNVATKYLCDIRDSKQVKATIQNILEAHHRVDILINNAGVWTDDALEKAKPEMRKNALDTNVLAHIQVIEELLPHFEGRNAGHILNVISTSGVSDIRDGNNSNWKTYGASKWALTGYTNALKKSLEETHLKVTSFFPCGFESNLYETAGRENPHNQPWMMDADDVADGVIFAITRPQDICIDSLTIIKK